MRYMILAAALMLGGTAVAQTTTEEDADTAAESTTMQSAPAPDATTSIPPPDMAPSGNMPMSGTGMTVAPGNNAPERDARGIPVMSAAAQAPAGYNEGARTVPAGSPMPTVAPPAPMASGPLPPCTRTVTDRCTQTYERGRAR